jgi:DNA-binding HxlR family transcriptional regulator
MYHCPVELALDVIGGKWRLRELQDAGLVSRAEVPPHVEYSLTEEGRSLGPALQALYDWGVSRAARTGAVIAPA